MKIICNKFEELSGVPKTFLLIFPLFQNNIAEIPSNFNSRPEFWANTFFRTNVFRLPPLHITFPRITLSAEILYSALALQADKSIDFETYSQQIAVKRLF